ncbi:MAG: YcjF family protein [Bradymonadaceae bacterium]
MSPQNNARKGLSDNILSLVERVLSFRYLRGLSDEKREALREDLGFIRETLLEQRPPRLAVVGSSEVDLPELIELMAGPDIAGDLDVKAYLGHNRWYDYRVRETEFDLLDLRTGPDEELSTKALDRQAPDVILFAWSYDISEDTAPDASIEALDRAVTEVQNVSGRAPPVVAVIDDGRLPEDMPPKRAERLLRKRLRNSGVPNTKFRVVQRSDVRDLDAELVELAPSKARLQLAQVVETPASRRRMARLVIQASAGIAATIATIPLPVADIIPITTTQILMIATVAHLGGRQFRLKTVGEFAAAIGLNVGAGYALRELARAILQLVPFAGSVISSGIATGATYALGNAAVEYFIGGGKIDFDAAPERVREPAWQRSRGAR